MGSCGFHSRYMFYQRVYRAKTHAFFMVIISYRHSFFSSSIQLTYYCTTELACIENSLNRGNLLPRAVLLEVLFFKHCRDSRLSHNKRKSGSRRTAFTPKGELPNLLELAVVRPTFSLHRNSQHWWSHPTLRGRQPRRSKLRNAHSCEKRNDNDSVS